MARTAPLQTFFTDRLARQQGASSHTIASYRDSLRLLMVFTAERTHVSPSELQIENLDPHSSPRSWTISSTACPCVAAPARRGRRWLGGRVVIVVAGTSSALPW